MPRKHAWRTMVLRIKNETKTQVKKWDCVEGYSSNRLGGKVLRQLSLARVNVVFPILVERSPSAESTQRKLRPSLRPPARRSAPRMSNLFLLPSQHRPFRVIPLLSFFISPCSSSPPNHPQKHLLICPCYIAVVISRGQIISSVRNRPSGLESDRQSSESLNTST